MSRAMRTARAVALVALLALSVVGLQLAPVVLLDSGRHGLAQAGHIDGEVAYVGDNGNDQVRAIYTDNQSTKWTYGRGGQDVAVSPSGDIVYTAGDDVFAAIYAGNGTSKWTKTRSSARSVSAVPGRDLVVGGDASGNVYVLDAADGSTVRSSSPHGQRVDGVAAGVDGERFFTVSEDGTAKGIYVENASTYCTKSPGNSVYEVSTGPNGDYWYVASSNSDQLDQYATADCSNGWSSSLSSIGRGVVAGPNGDRVYAVDNSGGLDAFDVSDGSTVWSKSPISCCGESHVGVGPDGANLYVADHYGDIYAFDSSDGSKKWEATNAIDRAGGITAGGSISTVKNHLNGTVTDADGNAIDSAKIEAVNTSTGSTEATTLTDANGFYEVAVASGTYDVTASKSGLSPTTKTVTVSGDATLNYTLTSETTITDPDPPDGATVSEPPVELSVLANTTNQSVQSIDVEFYQKQDGSSDSQIGSATVSPGERAAIMWDPPPGNYEWYAVGTADSGATDTGGPYSLGMGEADIVDGSEQPPDGAVVDPVEDVELAVDVRVDDDATVEFYDYETGNPANDPLIGSQSVSSGTSTPSTTWKNDNRSASEEWYVVLKDKTGTRDTAGAFAFGAGGVVVARDAETGNVIDDRTTRFDTVYPGGSQTFDRVPANLSLSEVNSEPGDSIRIDLRAQDYYERTIEVSGKQADADVYLERGANWSYNPSSDNPDQTASVDDDPDRFISRFTLKDQTGRYPPSDTKLTVRADIDDDGQTDLVHSSTFGAANRVDVRVKRDRRYQLVVENGDGDSRGLGGWTATEPETTTLTISRVTEDIEIDQGYGVDAEIDSGTLKIYYRDYETRAETLDLEVREYPDGSYLENRTLSDVSNATVTIALNESQSNKIWQIDYDGTRVGVESANISGQVTTSPVGRVPLPVGSDVLIAGALIILAIVGALFTGPLSAMGSVAMVGVAGVLYFIGWLPINAVALWVAGIVAVGSVLRSGGGRLG
jgi:hypothetical protein